MTIDNDKDRFAMNELRDLQNAAERAQEWYRNWQAALVKIEQASERPEFVAQEHIIVRFTLLEARTLLAAATNKGYVHPAGQAKPAFDRATKRMQSAIGTKERFDREPKEKRNYPSK